MKKDISMQAKSSLLLSLAAAVAALVAGPARAQDDVLADDKPAEESGDTAAEDAEKPTDAAPADDAAPAEASDEPLTTEETVFVVQGKPYLVAGSFEVTPQFVLSVNDQFTSHTGLAASAIYHLKENVAFEITGGVFGTWDTTGPRLGGRDTDLTIELREKEALAPERVKLYQFPWFIAADAQWSPMYGKVSVQDFVLGQFNLYLSVGAGALGLQLETTTQNGTEKTYADLPQPPIAWATSFGGGLRFYFTDWLGVRFEVRDYVIPLSVRPEEVEDADQPSFDVTNLVLGQVGVSFVF
jgi:outer membrane beta-barrel protein